MNAYVDQDKPLKTQKHTQKVINQYNVGMIIHPIHVSLSATWPFLWKLLMRGIQSSRNSFWKCEVTCY